MQQIFSQLGINWSLLLSQAVNFALLLIVLRIFVYKPLIKLLHDRRVRIEDGLTKADEAERRLREVDLMGKEALKRAENEAVALLKDTEGRAKTLEERLLGEIKKKESEESAAAAARLKEQEEASRRETEKAAAALVRQAIVRTVELSPEVIDDALIARAVKEAGTSA
jgi:F-type H+-transporting ATPase subunit b